MATHDLRSLRFRLTYSDTLIKEKGVRIGRVYPWLGHAFCNRAASKPLLQLVGFRELQVNYVQSKCERRQRQHPSW